MSEADRQCLHKIFMEVAALPTMQRAAALTRRCKDRLKRIDLASSGQYAVA